MSENATPASPKQHPVLPRWLTTEIVNLLMATVLATATIALAVSTCNTDKTVGKQFELFTSVKATLDEQAVTRAREEFDKALDEAEKLCPTCCSTCTPNYLIEVALDKALLAEPKAAQLLTAAEYNRLAILGSSVWGFQRTEQFVNKALDKIKNAKTENAKSESPLDSYMTYLVLGHIRFKHLADDPEHAKLNDAEDYFRKAIASIELASASESGQVHLGEGYSIWAAHEAFLHNNAEAEQKMTFAFAAWSRLPDKATIEITANDRTAEAFSGRKPEIACLFKSPGPCASAVPGVNIQPWKAPQTSPSPSVPPAPKAVPTPAPEPVPPAPPRPSTGIIRKGSPTKAAALPELAEPVVSNLSDN